jgi:hypothetical protein
MATTKASSSRSRTRSTRSTGNGNGSTTSQSKGVAEEGVEAATERIRELNERILESSKKAGKVYLDIYEKTLNSIADYQEKVGEQSQVEWITTVANAQARFTRDLAGAYSAATRSLLK